MVGRKWTQRSRARPAQSGGPILNIAASGPLYTYATRLLTPPTGRAEPDSKPEPRPGRLIQFRRRDGGQICSAGDRPDQFRATSIERPPSSRQVVASSGRAPGQISPFRESLEAQVARRPPMTTWRRGHRLASHKANLFVSAEAWANSFQLQLSVMMDVHWP